MQDNHHTRRVKLLKDTKTEKYFKLLLTFNDESKRYIQSYLNNFIKAAKRKEQEAKNE